MKGIIYKELLMLRRTLRSYVFCFIFVITFSVLIALSIQYGNLAMVPENAVDIMLMPIVELMPVVGSCMLIFGVTESVSNHDIVSWRRFCRTMPINPWKYSLSNHIIIVFSVVFAIGFSLGYTAIFCSSMGQELTGKKIATDMFFVASVLLMSVFSGFFINLFQNRNKAFLLMYGIFMTAGMFVFVILGVELSDTMIEEILKIFLPFAPLVIIALLAASYVSTALLYKRREK